MMIILAFAVDAAIYILVGLLTVWVARKRLPDPWGQPSFTIPVVLAIGLLLSLITFPHWVMQFD